MPRLETDRLLLRPPEIGDVAAITTWIGDYDVSKNLAAVAHPFREADARAFVGRAAEALAKGEAYSFAIVRKAGSVFMGGIGLRLKDGRYELGYWLGKPFWGQGYATEAARRVVAFAFHDLGAETVWAGWFHDNPASGRVLAKLGAQPDGFEPRMSLARGHEVACNTMTLTRAEFGRKRASFEASRAAEARA